MDKKTEFNFELTDPFEYATKGGLEIAGFIKFTAPSTKNMTHCANLKQMFFRALPKNDNIDVEKLKELKEEAKKSEEAMTGGEIIMMLSASPHVELDKFFVTIQELFTKGSVALIDGEEKLTRPLFDLVSMEDLENMAGDYLANFILASSLNRI